METHLEETKITGYYIIEAKEMADKLGIKQPITHIQLIGHPDEPTYKIFIRGTDL